MSDESSRDAGRTQVYQGRPGSAGAGGKPARPARRRRNRDPNSPSSRRLRHQLRQRIAARDRELDRLRQLRWRARESIALPYIAFALMLGIYAAITVLVLRLRGVRLLPW